MTNMVGTVEALAKVMQQYGIIQLKVADIEMACQHRSQGANVHNSAPLPSPTSDLHAGTDLDDFPTFPHASPLSPEELEMALHNLGNELA